MGINRHLRVFLESGIQEKYGWDVLAQGLSCVWSHMISRAEVVSETSSLPFLVNGLVRWELLGTGAGRASHGLFLYLHMLSSRVSPAWWREGPQNPQAAPGFKGL